ncbi:biotin/lipoyl-binding protein, partial [Enterococcus faecium]
MTLPRPLIPLAIIAGILGAGYWVDQARAQRASRLSGYFESQPTELASRLTGRVQSILVKEGDPVKKGQVLVRLEAETDLA